MNSLSPLYIQVFDRHFDLLLLSQREWPVTEASLHLWALHLWTLVCLLSPMDTILWELTCDCKTPCDSLKLSFFLTNWSDHFPQPCNY